MTDININALPAAAAFTDADIAHLSQSGADVKTTMGALKAEFVDVDVFGLTEDTTPDTAMFVAVGVDGVIANNKKVSLEKVGILLQAESFYSNDEGIDVDDEIIYRKDNESTLKQVTTGGLAARILTLSELANALTASGINDSDLNVVYDVSTTEAKKITVADNRQATFIPTNLSALTDLTIDNADYVYIWDTSTSTAKKMTYANFKTAVAAGLPFADYLSSTTADNAVGLITFDAGLKTNTIAPATGTDIVISAKVTVNSEIVSALGNFTNVKGKYLGTNGNSGSLYIDSVSSGSKFLIKGNQLSPVDNLTTELGTSGEAFKKSYIGEMIGNSISADTAAAMPNPITIRNAANTINIPLMSSDTISPSILPVSTTSLLGGVLTATLSQIQTGSGATAAITAAGLASAITLPSPIPQTTTSGEDIFGGHLEIGGLLINYGWVENPNANCVIDLSVVGLGCKAHTTTDYVCMLTSQTSAGAAYATEKQGSRTASSFEVGTGAGATTQISFITIGKV